MNGPSPWLLATIRTIDRFTDVTGTVVSWLSLPLVAAVAYEVVARYAFNAPTIWVFDTTYMLYGTLFMLGAAYALHKGAHIRTDFFWEQFSTRKKGWIDSSLRWPFSPATLALDNWYGVRSTVGPAKTIRLPSGEKEPSPWPTWSAPATTSGPPDPSTSTQYSFPPGRLKSMDLLSGVQKDQSERPGIPMVSRVGLSRSRSFTQMSLPEAVYTVNTMRLPTSAKQR